MNLTKILSYVFLAISLGLAYYLFRSIKTTIDTREAIAKTEAAVIEKLEIIREAEKVFYEQFGRYTSNWDSLTTFIQSGEVPIVVRKETITQLGYGRDSVTVSFDTIGYNSAYDRIFKASHSVTAADSGRFIRYYVSNGDSAYKNAPAYRMTSARGADDHAFRESGIISSITPLSPGDRLTKGQLLISYWNYRFNPNIDIANLSKVPGSGATFDIYTGFTNRSGTRVAVIEVRDPDPINPARSESNEAKNRQPLRFGSRNDVSLSGNWEF